MHQTTERVYRNIKPITGKKYFRHLLGHYGRLVMLPRINAHLSAQSLDAQRSLAAQDVIRAAMTMQARPGYNRMSIAQDLAEFLEHQPANCPWYGCDRLTLERWTVDILHTLKREGVAA